MRLSNYVECVYQLPREDHALFLSEKTKFYFCQRRPSFIKIIFAKKPNEESSIFMEKILWNILKFPLIECSSYISKTLAMFIHNPSS